jgi:hypothetical protein
MLLVYGFPADGVVTPAYFYMVLATTVATSFTRYFFFFFLYSLLHKRDQLLAVIEISNSCPFFFSLFDPDSTVSFVSMGAFMTVIADPVIGGTYMTVSNETFRRSCLFSICCLLNETTPFFFPILPTNSS